MTRLKPAAVLGMCLMAAACTPKWQPQRGPVPQIAGASEGGTVRLILKEGSPLVMTHLRVEGDSIHGLTGTPARSRSVATEDVSRIDFEAGPGGTSTNVVIGAIGVIFLAILLTVDP